MNEYFSGSSDFSAIQYSHPVPVVDVSWTRISPRSVFHLTRLGPYIDAKFRAHVNIKIASPEALDEKPIEHRRDIQLKLEVSVSAEPFGADTLGCCIQIPKTKSVKRFGSHNG